LSSRSRERARERERERERERVRERKGEGEGEGEGERGREGRGLTRHEGPPCRLDRTHPATSAWPGQLRPRPNPTGPGRPSPGRFDEPPKRTLLRGARSEEDSGLAMVLASTKSREESGGRRERKEGILR